MSFEERKRRTVMPRSSCMELAVRVVRCRPRLHLPAVLPHFTEARPLLVIISTLPLVVLRIDRVEQTLFLFVRLRSPNQQIIAKVKFESKKVFCEHWTPSTFLAFLHIAIKIELSLLINFVTSYYQHCMSHYVTKCMCCSQQLTQSVTGGACPGGLSAPHIEQVSSSKTEIKCICMTYLGPNFGDFIGKWYVPFFKPARGNRWRLWYGQGLWLREIAFANHIHQFCYHIILKIGPLIRIYLECL